MTKTYKIIQDNPYFFILFLIFILSGAVLLSSIAHGDVLLFFDNNRSASLNIFFKYFTKAGEEWAYIFWIFIFLFIRYRVAILIPIIGLVVTIISFLSKNYFLRPRPSTYYKSLNTFEELNLIEGVHVVKGLSSFPSGHTMSAFALFTLVAFFIKNKKILGAFLFCCAFLVGISRIYLVQHFFEDVYLGAILGVIIALLIYKIQAHLSPTNQDHWMDKRINFP